MKKQTKTSLKDFRKQFIAEMDNIMTNDNKVILLYGDVGFNYLDCLIKKFPDRVINCGLAEQNMVGVALGLALAGKKPWVYSMINFIVFRPYEQIRTACYHNANIKIIGVQGSPAYRFLGFTHNIIQITNGLDEDLTALFNMPNLQCYAPQTATQATKVIKKASQSNKPFYIRI